MLYWFCAQLYWFWVSAPSNCDSCSAQSLWGVWIALGVEELLLVSLELLAIIAALNAAPVVVWLRLESVNYCPQVIRWPVIGLTKCKAVIWRTSTKMLGLPGSNIRV